MNDIAINGLTNGRPPVTSAAGENGKSAAEAPKGQPVELPGSSAADAQSAAFGAGAVDPLERASRAINELFGPNKENLKLRIEHDEASGRFVIQSVDKDTGEVVQQFPPEEILAMIAYFREIEGLAVDGVV